mgnify:CR=1 FL=1
MDQVFQHDLMPLNRHSHPHGYRQYKFEEQDLLLTKMTLCVGHFALNKILPDVSVPTSIKNNPSLSVLHFQDAWAAGYTGKGIIIADIDTGIDLQNKEKETITWLKEAVDRNPSNIEPAMALVMFGLIKTSHAGETSHQITISEYK